MKKLNNILAVVFGLVFAVAAVLFFKNKDARRPDEKKVKTVSAVVAVASLIAVPFAVWFEKVKELYMKKFGGRK